MLIGDVVVFLAPIDVVYHRIESKSKPGSEVMIYKEGRCDCFWFVDWSDEIFICISSWFNIELFSAFKYHRRIEYFRWINERKNCFLSFFVLFLLS